MTNAPGIGGVTKGAPGATVLYCVALTSITKYPFAPPPRVNGTSAVFALSCQKISCNLSKVGPPMIFVSTLYSKYNSLRLIFVVVIMLENSLGYTPLLFVGCCALLQCALHLDTLYLSDSRSVLLTTKICYYREYWISLS